MKHCNALLLVVLGFGQVIAQPTRVTNLPSRPVGELLNQDGSLNTEAGYSGSVDVTKYRMITGPTGAPMFKALTATADEWDDTFFLPGADYIVTSLAISGSNIYVGGWFTAVNGVAANKVAMWNGTTWTALGSGGGNGVAGGNVFAIAVSGSNVYVGGDFTAANAGETQITVNAIAKWNGTSWSAVGTDGNGLNSYVNALATTGDSLFVGGAFTVANSGGTEVTANRIAVWTGSAWDSIGTSGGNGLNATVNAIAVSGSDVYVGGDFTISNAGGAEVTANYIAMWDGSAWDSLGSDGNGTNNVVSAVAIAGSDVYVGGTFSTANNGGTTVTANHIAKWSGSAWSSVGSNGNGVDGNTVSSIAVSGTDVYVGGDFATVNSGGTEVIASGVAKWSGSAWSSLGSGGGEGVSASVNALAVSGSDLYVGGAQFTKANVLGTEVTAVRLAKWNGASWSALGSGSGNGVNGDINAIAVSGSDVYIGGTFTAVYSAGEEMTANKIAKWDGSSWSSVGTGSDNGVAPSSVVFAIAVSGTDVYVGGSFTTAGSIAANRIARWDGASWNALGSGLSTGSIRAIAVSGTDVFAGALSSSGTFGGTAGGDRIARWDGISWNAMGTGLNGTARAIAVAGTDVYVGGDFTTAGGSTANRVAKWDGSTWSALGSGGNGVDGAVSALAVSGGDVYVGGSFTNANVGAAVAANRIAKWDGSSWGPLGSDGNGVDATVSALAVSGSDVYAGGSFTSANVGGSAVAASYVARWDGSDWNAVGSDGGSGLSNTVGALAVAGSDLFAGGTFLIANSDATTSVGSSKIARWFSRYASTPATASSGTVRAGGDTVTFGTTAVSIALTSGDTGQFNVYRYSDSPVNVSGVTGNVSSYRWIIHQLGLDTAAAGEVRFKISDIPSNGISVPDDVDVYARSTPGTGAFSALTTAYEGGTGEIVADITGFSEFVFGSVTDPLPVQVVSFTAVSDRFDAELHWVTETEVSSAGFSIERRNAGSSGTPVKASGYAEVGFVDGAGTSTARREYAFVDRDLAPGRYDYRIRHIDRDGSSSYTESVEVQVGLAPIVFHIGQNYPNPFNPTTTIEFTLPGDGRVTLKVYNMLGQDVGTLIDEDLVAGVYHRATWNAGGVPSGTYIARLTHSPVAGDPGRVQYLAKKLLLVK